MVENLSKVRCQSDRVDLSKLEIHVGRDLERIYEGFLREAGFLRPTFSLGTVTITLTGVINSRRSQSRAAAIVGRDKVKYCHTLAIGSSSLSRAWKGEVAKLLNK
jgi:hypothetical protein